MISIGRLIAIGATALLFRMLWMKAAEERASAAASRPEPVDVDVDALAEEKPDMQGAASPL